MLKAIHDLQRRGNLGKILYSMVRVMVVFFGVTMTGQALDVIFQAKVVYAEENTRHVLSKRGMLKFRNSYDLKIRESLKLQKDFGNPVSALQTLDSLFEAIKKKITPRPQYNKEEAIRALKTIGDVLKEEGKFEYGRNNLLIEGLEKQKNGKRFIDCDDYSSIYLFAGERLGLSIVPVYAPKHVFLRCRSNDSRGFYWEPTLASEKDFYFYKAWLNITEDSGYPKILNEKEFEAIQLSNLGVAWYEKGDYEKAIKYYMKAVELNPDFFEAYNNLGVSYAKQGNYSQAIKCYKKATKKELNYATPFSNLGVAFYRLGYLDRAIKYFEKAIEVDPNYKRAYHYKVVVLLKKGDRKKALKFLRKIRKLKSGD
ncbi:MAG: tetratricopeptide repeat protein [Candidatus Aminicenantes bacterium]|nr:tetratricopeptide repeat protein [Candidatus Aminicenantes bacterium]